MNKLKKIVNKISHLKSVFTPADKYNDLVDNLNELTTVVEELSNNSGGGGTTDLFTNTTASKVVKTNSNNNGLESIDLFANTKPYYGVGTNSTNDAIEYSKFYYKEDGDLNASILIGRQANPWTTASTAPQFKVPKSIIIGSDGGNHTISKNTLSGIIALNSPEIRTSDIVSIGNYYHKVFITNGNQIRRKFYYIVSDGNAQPEYSLLSLIMGGYINGNDSAKTLTITLDNIDNELREYFINSSNGMDKWIHTEVDFLIDNTIATGTNHITVAVSGNDISVNGTDNLVVNAGTIGKFTGIIHSTPGGAYQKVKICRVF